MGITNEGLSCC